MTVNYSAELYHDFSASQEDDETFFTRDAPGSLGRLTRFSTVGENAAMATRIPSDLISTQSPADLPDRLCTWCKVAMRKRLVASGQFVHYTCPTCVFQHTIRRGPKPAAPAH
ncbi:MAG: hypothetical protein JW388_0015 [Nitrospira sp.]|nr:hypothetical protein [Nitrospira sp.]